MQRTVLTAAAAVLTLTLGSVSYAAPPWNDHPGQGKGKPHPAEARQGGGGPPPWAPAHGYRAKYGEQHYRESFEIYERRSREFGIASGTCHREALGTVLGGVVGGVVGSRIGEDEHRTVATVAGVAVGALIGREIGRRMDRADHACTGQVLERAADHETVHWRNPDTGVEYRVTPERTFEQQDRFCRSYTTVALTGGDRQRLRETACRRTDGSWHAM